MVISYFQYFNIAMHSKFIYYVPNMRVYLPLLNIPIQLLFYISKLYYNIKLIE